MFDSVAASEGIVLTARAHWKLRLPNTTWGEGQKTSKGWGVRSYSREESFVRTLPFARCLNLQLVACKALRTLLLRAVKRNYAAIDAGNASLGIAGELVVAVEERSFFQTRLEGLAARVEHVAATRGCGLRNDVRSFDSDGENVASK